MSVLQDSIVREQLRDAWNDSQPGTPDAHEEGGFILQMEDGSLTVCRWPRGQKDEIEVPDHLQGKYQGRTILATFHTHPNPAPEYLQEPGLTDIRAVRDDPDLKHPEYEGEFVISMEEVWFIDPDGVAGALGSRVGVLGGEP